MRPRRIFVNEAFRPQRISGQQRYATEIADRLPDGWVRLVPEGVWARSKLATWLWLQTVVPLRSLRGVLVSMTARAPLWHPRHVVVIHDLFVIEHPEWFSRKYSSTHAPLQRFQMRNAAALVAVSEPVARQLHELRPNDTIAVAPNAPSRVFEGPGSPEGVSVHSRHGLEPGEFLLTVGNLEPRKNLARLAEAFGALPDEVRRRHPLVVIGAGASIYGGSAVRWPDEVILAGYVSDEELAILYASARAVVFPSLAEGFGLPIVEAAAARARALLLSDLPVFRWIAGEGATYFDPSDVGAITEALRHAAESDVRAPAVDLTRFQWDVSAAVVEGAAVGVASGSRTR